MQVLLEENCASCHDGVPGRPQLGIHAELDDAAAYKALLVLSAGKMPPRAETLAPPRRTQLIFELCRSRTQPRQAQCLAYFDKAAMQAPVIRTVSDVLRELTLAGIIRPSAPATSAVSPAAPAAKGTDLRTNPELLRLLLVLEECPELDRKQPETEQAFRACAEQVLARELRSPAP